ncbi:MAG: glycosyltransferase family 39 protein [Candidatus Coatesbacteria bacterium]|nr:glycosyltransferase family 39 protein [Candidatus Coatesbacteria bacterium]
MFDKTYSRISLLLLLAFIMSFYLIPRRQIWIDEVGSWIESGMPLKEMIAFNSYPKDTHPPLYYILLHFYRKIIPEQKPFDINNNYKELTNKIPSYPFEIHLRLFSSFFALLSIISTYYLALKIYNDSKTAFLSSLLMIFSSAFLYYSREIRMYSLLLLISSTSSLFFLLYLDKKKIKYALIYSLVSASGLYTHYFMIPLLAIQWLYFLLVNIKKINFKTLKEIYPLFMTFIFFIPYIMTFMKHARVLKEQAIFKGISPFMDFVSLFRWYFFGYYLKPLPVTIIGYLLIALILGISVYYFRTRLRENLFLNLFIWLPPLFALLASLLLNPVNQKRFFIIFLPYIFIFISYGLLRIKRIFMLVIILLFISISIYSDYNYRMDKIYGPSKKIATYLKANYRKGEDVIISQGVAGKYIFGDVGFYLSGFAEFICIHREDLMLINQKYFLNELSKKPDMKLVFISPHIGQWNEELLKTAIREHIINKKRIWLCDTIKLGDEDLSSLFSFYETEFGFKFIREKSIKDHSFQIYLLEKQI